MTATLPQSYEPVSSLSLSVKKRVRAVVAGGLGPLIVSLIVLAAIGVTLIAVGIEASFEYGRTFLDSVEETIRRVANAHDMHGVVYVYLFRALMSTFLLGTAVVAGHILPQSTSSGVPELSASLSGLVLSDALSLPVLIMRTLGLLCTLLAGLVVGREGVQIALGGGVAYIVLSLPFWPGGRIIPSSRNGLEILAAAAAAGVVVTFKTLLGGVLFAFEVTGTSFASSLLAKSVFSVLVARYVLSQFSVGRHPTLGQDFEGESYSLNTPRILAAAAVGVLMGLLSGLFVQCHSFLTGVQMRKRAEGRRFTSYLLMVVSVAFGVSLCTMVFPVLRLRSNDMLTGLFSNKEFFSTIKWPVNSEGLALSLAAVLQILLTLVCTTLPVSAGLFSPVFVAGAIIGRAIGNLNVLDRESLFSGDPRPLAVLGAGALAGGVTQTISTAVIMFELVESPSFLPMILVAVLCANAVARVFAPSIYAALVRKKRLPFLDTLPVADYAALSSPNKAEEEVLDDFTLASDSVERLPEVETRSSFARLCSSTAGELSESVVAVPASAHPSAYDAALDQCDQTEFPVVEDDGTMITSVPRELLAGIMRRVRITTRTGRTASIANRISRSFSVARAAADRRMTPGMGSPLSQRTSVHVASPGTVPESPRIESPWSGTPLVSGPCTYRVDLIDLADALKRHSWSSNNTFTVGEQTLVSQLLLFVRLLPLQHIYVVNDMHRLTGVVRRDDLFEIAVSKKTNKS